MHIILSTETPNGTTCTIHRVQSVTIGSPVLGENTIKIIVMVNSYANDTATQLAWSDQHEMPIDVFTQGTYPDVVYNWLVSDQGFFTGGVIVADEITEIDALKLKKKASIQTLRDQNISKGCTTPAGVVDTDAASLRNIMATYQAAALALLTSNPFSITWRMADNSSVTLDSMGMIGMGNAVLARTKAIYENSWALKASLAAATTIEEANAVDPSTGWPAL